MSHVSLPLDRIRTDGGTQPRLGIDYDVAYGYGDLMAEGVKFPPVTVFYDGENYWLADGFHRYHAAFAQEMTEIAADVIQGTIEDAQWFSFGANKAHGLMRSNDDKQRAVKAALQHPKCAGLSDNQIAKHVGVNQTTVSAWRKKLGASYGIPKIDNRTATRNGTTYEINTSNIGKKQVPQAESAPAGGNEEAKTTVGVDERKQAWPSTGRRLEMMQNAHFNKVAESIGTIIACCDVLERCNIEQASLAGSGNEISQWLKTIEASIARLKKTKKEMERVESEHANKHSDQDDSCEGFEDTSYRPEGSQPNQAQAH